MQPPGREGRWSEKAFQNAGDLAAAATQAIVPLLTMPFVFFGHSLGAMTAFEVARRLRRAGQPMPQRLFASAHRAPQLPHPHPIIHRLPDAEFSARILAGQNDRRTGNTYTPQLTPGRWWTISTTFHDQLTGFGNFESNIHMADRIILKVDATGTFRVWSGPIYIDDIGWR